MAGQAAVERYRGIYLLIQMSDPTRKRITNNNSSDDFNKVVHEGALQKKGKKFSMWHYRWFILLKSGAIMCKDEGKKLKSRFIVSASTRINLETSRF